MGIACRVERRGRQRPRRLRTRTRGPDRREGGIAVKAGSSRSADAAGQPAGGFPRPLDGVLVVTLEQAVECALDGYICTQKN